MKNWFAHHRIPILFTAVCVALSLLILFQISWLSTSRDLIEEQFDQRVSLALGNAMSMYKAEYGNEFTLNSSSCNTSKDCYVLEAKELIFPMTKREDLETMLSNSMASFGIEEAYDVAIINSCNLSCCSVLSQEKKSYNCSIAATNVAEDDIQLNVSFPCRSAYVFDHIKYMLLSSILISLLLGIVSFVILRALILQKRITEHNIDFFNNAAHELKTPLTNISLALSLFKRKNKDQKDANYLQIIDRESSKLANQIERVLYLSKLETGNYQMEEVELDLKKVVREAVDYMDMIRAEKDGIIEFDFPAESCLIKGDPFHLSNICINLIDNALKYCQVKPLLKISIQEHGDRYRLAFLDNGIGIRKCDQAHIFKKFQRVHTGDVQNVKGFGVGLSYVQKALELHRGFIQVQSELDKGSQFEISLPRY